MAYQSRGIQFPGGDYGASYIAGAGEAIGRGLSDLGGGIGKAVDERQKSKALQSRFDMLADQGYATPELRDKFYKGSTSQQAGIMAELMATMDRDEAAAKERESKRRFDLGYKLDAARMGQQADQFGQRMRLDQMQAGQDAAYRNATLEQNQEELEARNRPVEWKLMEGTNYMANEKGSVVPLAAKEKLPGFVGDAAGVGYYQNTQGQPVNPRYLMQSGGLTGLPDPLKPYAKDFEDAAATYGVDPQVLGAISMFETGDGRSPAFRDRNNAMGISNSSGPTAQPSVRDGIMRMARVLADPSGPYAKAKTIEELGAVYAPVGASNDPNKTNGEWAGGVRQKLEMLRRSAPQPLVSGGAQQQARVQTATIRDAEGNEQLVQLLPDGTYRPMQPAPAPAAAPGQAPAKPNSRLGEFMQKYFKK